MNNKIKSNEDDLNKTKRNGNNKKKMDIGGISLREYRGQKIIKSLETIAIIILIISFVALAYCVYISFTTEKNYASDYTAEPTSVSNKAEEKKIFLH